MSTKSLMADKRVAEVTLNALGKAATLTLKEPWLYEGSAGPFTLTNVEHGHKIVKAATGGETAKRAPRTATPATPKPAGEPVLGGPNAEDIEPPRLSAQRRDPNEDKGWVYRVIAHSPEHNHEVASWHKMAGRRTEEQMVKHVRAFFPYPAMRDKMGETYTDVRAILWTQEHEKAARAANDSGCPWPGDVR